MLEDDSADVAAKPLDSQYLSGLLDNISATQDHLAGNDGTPLMSSFLHPNAVWTPQEKDTLFHALSVHSRFRPDLISHEIKTKSVPEVCNYLTTLRLAASQEENVVPYSQWRQNLPIATEVSSEWIAMEEEAALDITTREQDWQQELTAERRRAELKSLKKASKAKSQGIGQSRTKAELEQELSGANLRGRREDFCGSLGSSELTAIASVLRDAVSSPNSIQIKQSSSIFYHPSPSPPAGRDTELEPAQTLPFSSEQAADTQQPPNPARQRPISDGKPLSQSSPQGFQTRSPKQDSTSLLTELSPASRRRYQKRLYMRRKRASVAGVAAVDESLERLKPGRKKVKRSPPPEDETRCVPDGGDHDKEDNEDAALGPEVNGCNAPQKRYSREKRMAIEELQNLGLVEDDFKSMGLDVLNPEGVAKMLNLWDRLSGDSGHGARISAETIQLLDAHLIWFVKSVIYRAITLREQELTLKSETKVWKLSEKPVLTREHVERAVSMGNSRELNKAGTFEAIIADMEANATAEKTRGELVESGPNVTVPSLRREVYAPLVWIPEPGDDSEMTDNTDDEELDNELIEEEELDELDMDAEMKHESGLWDKTQKFRDSGLVIERTITKEGQRAVYKSAELVEDSD